MMGSVHCNVCQAAEPALVYESAGAQSLTSLAQTLPYATLVRACSRCGHVQTDSVLDEAAFYDKSYNILTASEDEDQIYEVRDGRPVFRTEHQVATLLSKLTLSAGMRLLDYGCAKSATYRALAKTRCDLDLHLFDVSDQYVSFWRSFMRESNWATYEPKAVWRDSFDVITSFFAFEHISDPVSALRNVASLMKPGATFYCVVPDIFGNTADLIVVDHVNHFTVPSMTAACERAGFEMVEIDCSSHRGAMVVQARKPEVAGASVKNGAPVGQVNEAIARVRTVGSFWTEAAERVREFERSVAGEESLAVYGAGFYGAFLLASMRRPDRVSLLVDQNPHIVGTVVNGRPVIHPADLPAAVSVVLAGLNPARAREIIGQIPSLANVRVFYL